MDEKFFEKKFGRPQKSEKEPSGDAEIAISPEETRYLRWDLEMLTAKYENDERFKKTVEELEKIAQGQGFEGLLIEDGSAGISCGGYTLIPKLFGRRFTVAKYPENKVRIGEVILENIRDLFRTDREFAQGGFSDIFFHEKEEGKGPAEIAYQREYLELKKFLKEPRTFKEVNEKISELESKYYPPIEMQTELQRITKSYKDLDDFIERQAREEITFIVAHKGFDYLKETKYTPETELPELHFSFIKPNLHKPILERMEEMRKELLKKYDELKSKE